MGLVNLALDPEVDFDLVKPDCPAHSQNRQFSLTRHKINGLGMEIQICAELLNC